VYLHEHGVTVGGQQATKTRTALEYFSRQFAASAGTQPGGDDGPARRRARRRPSPRPRLRPSHRRRPPPRARWLRPRSGGPRPRRRNQATEIVAAPTIAATVFGTAITGCPARCRSRPTAGTRTRGRQVGDRDIGRRLPFEHASDLEQGRHRHQHTPRCGGDPERFDHGVTDPWLDARSCGRVRW
jgi:hypothetical protein